MKTEPEQKSSLVYILHFDAPVRGKQHYCGITAAGRLNQRMKDHLGGHGSSLTGAAVKKGIGWHVGALFNTYDPGLERRLKKQSRFRSLCQICNHSGDGPALFAEYLHFVPVARPPQHNLLSWR